MSLITIRFFIKKRVTQVSESRGLTRTHLNLPNILWRNKYYPGSTGSLPRLNQITKVRSERTLKSEEGREVRENSVNELTFLLFTVLSTERKKNLKV